MKRMSQVRIPLTLAWTCKKKTFFNIKNINTNKNDDQIML
jgi:hypothetical protein